MTQNDKITKEEFIKQVSCVSHRDMKSIRDVINSMEEVLTDIALELNEENNKASVKLFNGITFDVEYISEKEKTNNLTGEHITVESHLKPKFTISRVYRDRLNEKRFLKV